MLLQDFFANVRPHRVHTKHFYEEYSILSNNIIGQRKTTDIVEKFYS